MPWFVRMTCMVAVMVRRMQSISMMTGGWIRWIWTSKLVRV